MPGVRFAQARLSALRQMFRSSPPRYQVARRGCRPAAGVDLSSTRAGAIDESPLVFLPAYDSNLVPLSRHVPESRLDLHPQTSPFLSASRKARTQTRRGPSV